MIITHSIQNIRFDQSFIYLQIDVKEVKISLAAISAKLKMANDRQRNFYKISPSGYGIHWPLIDEDLSIESLLKISEQV